MITLNDPTLLIQRCHINGSWCDADSGATMDVTNPATGEIIATVPRMGSAETRRAVRAAAAALPGWSGTLARERARVLRRWYELIMASQEDLALLMTCEQGKPLAESRGEIAYAASFIEWFSEEAPRITGNVIMPHQHDKRILVFKRPVGVCAAITPWNFPAAMIARKAGAALAAGCTMVLKPASMTPLSALALMELGIRAGLPAGVLNLVTGSAAEIGDELTSNPLVRKLTFTGSTETGKKLMAQCAGTVKKLSLELGGNAPFIVFHDADLEAAVEGAMVSKFRNSGQTCVCANRFLVHEAVYDAFCEKFSARVRELRVGDGRDDSVQQGPLMEMAALLKVEQLIADALTKGARLVVGGRRHSLGGTFFQPTVLAEATPEMLLAREEIFGPVAPLFRFSGEEEAIALANDTGSGLAAYCYTRDQVRAWRLSEALEYGMVGLNTGLISTAVAPFGGIKESGLGREGSVYGIDEYLEITYVCVGGVA